MRRVVYVFGHLTAADMVKDVECAARIWLARTSMLYEQSYPTSPCCHTSLVYLLRLVLHISILIVPHPSTLVILHLSILLILLQSCRRQRRIRSRQDGQSEIGSRHSSERGKSRNDRWIGTEFAWVTSRTRCGFVEVTTLQHVNVWTWWLSGKDHLRCVWVLDIRPSLACSNRKRSSLQSDSSGRTIRLLYFTYHHGFTRLQCIRGPAWVPRSR
jgi:hypothetical protein